MNTQNTTNREVPSAALSHAWAGNFGQLIHEILQEPLQQHTATPRIRFIEKQGSYEIQAALPGIIKEQIALTIADGIFTLTAKGATYHPNDAEKVHISELNTATYKRSLRLPKNADTEQTEATLDHGILTVVFAKRPESLSKTIDIK